MQHNLKMPSLHRVCWVIDLLLMISFHQAKKSLTIPLLEDKSEADIIVDEETLFEPNYTFFLFVNPVSGGNQASHFI